MAKAEGAAKLIMSKKAYVSLGLIVGSIAGGGVAAILGFSALSMVSILASFVGSVVGIWIGMKFGE